MLSASRTPTASRSLISGESYLPLVRQWAFRLLLDGYGHRLLFSRGRFDAEDLLIDLEVLEESEDDPSQAEVMRAIRQQAKSAELGSNIPDGQFGHNLQQLSQALQLSPVEGEVLGFLVLKEQDTRLSQVIELYHQRNWVGAQQLASLIAIALKRPRRLVSDALSDQSVLKQCGLIIPEEHQNTIDLLDGLDDLLLFENEGTQTLLKSFTLPSPPAHLSEADFTHVLTPYQRIERYLRSVQRKRLGGVNILLYGSPGTGKTEMVRTLSDALCMDLHEVKSSLADGRPMKGERRLAAYQVAQKMLSADRDSLLLFDEVEDVFNDKVSSQYKAWINQTLEHNPRPCFWLSNSVTELDQAFIRRFDLVMEMPELNRKARLAIARRVLKGLNVREEWLMKLSKRKGVHAAHLAQAARVVRNLGYRKPERVEDEIDALLASLYQALGQREKRKQPKPTKHFYHPAFSNTDQSLEVLTQGLQRSRMGRICLYGPPGTGKSGFAQHLASELKMPLVAKNASDLLDMYVGGTERALASAFDEARHKKGILLIDEADSFLSPRSQAQRSWEVTQVNELLVQMERYEGILIMSTNFIGHLDSAALRRFDFKVRFNYLNPEQVWMFFNNLLGRINETGIDRQPGAEIRPALDRLSQLTPGDFATVERRHKVIGQRLTPENLLLGLQQEHAIKTAHQGRAIGFIQ